MSAFLVYISKVALLTAVFVLLYHLLLRRDTFHRTARIVLVSSLLASYILPFCIITVHRSAPASVVTVDDRQEPHVLSQPQSPASAQIQTQSEPQFIISTVAPSKQVDWILVAMVFYVIGTVCLIILRLLSIRSVRTLIRHGHVALKRDGCKIVISKDKIRPFSWMRYIVLPEGYLDLSCSSAVIRHEYSHISHHHSIELLAVDILSAFQWFNPLVWLLRHDLCCVQEFQADASVLESGVDRVEYEKSLLSIAIGGLSIPLVNGLGESSLRTRVRMMNRKLSGHGNLLKLIYLPIVLVLALMLMSNTVYDVPALKEPVMGEEPVMSDDMLVLDSEFESIPSDDGPAETDIEELMDADEPERAQTLLARFDGSLLESHVALMPYQDDRELPQFLPDRLLLDSLKKQYPELNSLESIHDDGIITNDKPYKGYISCIRLSKGTYSFWVMGLKEKEGRVVSIELGNIDEAIEFLNDLVSSYGQGNTVSVKGQTLTGIKGNAYTLPRTDGVEPGPYLINVKNLKHDLSVLEKRKTWGTANYDEIGFFTMENKPDDYELVMTKGNHMTYENIYVHSSEDCGETSAAIQIERLIRERAGEGHVPGSIIATNRFNGVIIFPLQKKYLSDGRIEYYQPYIPINYDPLKYQAPLTDYQRSLKRRVFKRDSKKANSNEVPYDQVGFFTMENKPDEYEVLLHDSRLAEMTLNEREDGGSSESWAAIEIEKKIRDLASRGIRNDVAYTRFNGVILVGELTRGYNEFFGTWYRQYYIPINYNQEKYQAPLTDYQRSLKRTVFRRR